MDASTPSGKRNRGKDGIPPGPGDPSPQAMEALLTVILVDDIPQARALLTSNPGLATCPIASARLYQAKILHWIYAGDTALHLAAAGYRVELVQLLLASGADPNSALNHRKSGPLHYAADGFINLPAGHANPQVRTIQCLLEAGAEINAPDKNGATPLHRAVRTRSAAAVQCLLTAGADATLKNKPGSTPFHLAVQNTGRSGSGTEAAKTAQQQIILALLAAGVNPALKDGQGKSVLDWARSPWLRNLLSGNFTEPG